MSWIRPTDICVVTGGNNGLGKEILRHFAKQGCPTVSLDIAPPENNTSKAEENSELSSLSDAERPVTDAKEPKVLAQEEVIGASSSSETARDNSPLATTAGDDDIMADSPEVGASASTDNESEDNMDLEPTLTIQCDVRKQEDLENARLQILKKFDRYPAIVVLNAGIRRPLNTIADSNYSDLQDTLDVNLGGVVKCVRTFLPDMIEGQRGFLVSVASALGIIVPKGLGAYGASKAGIIGFHEALRQELLVHKDVHAMLVCPGQLATTMFSDVRTPSTVLAPIVAPDQLAAKIVKRVGKAKSSTIYAPSYVRYLQLMNSVPVSLAQLVRKFSGVDQVYDEIIKERIAKASGMEIQPESDSSEAEMSSGSLSPSDTPESPISDLAIPSNAKMLKQPESEHEAQSEVQAEVQAEKQIETEADEQPKSQVMVDIPFKEAAVESSEQR